MNPLKEMPMGFGMALIQNEKSAKFYENCTSVQKAAILNQVHMIESKEEMQAFVDNLPSETL